MCKAEVAGLRHGEGKPYDRAPLAEVLAAGPVSSWRALELVSEFARTVQLAHLRGQVIGCAQASRVVLGPTGLRPAPGGAPPPGSTPDDDVRGLGAVLYAMVTGFWPLDPGDDEPAGLPAAPRDSQGVVVAPGALDPAIGFEVSDLAMAALGADARQGRRERLRTAAAVARVAEDIRLNWTAELLPPLDATAPEPDSLWRADQGRSGITARVGPSRRAATGLLGLSMLTLTVLSYVGIEAAALLGITSGARPPIVVPPDSPEAAPVAVTSPATPPPASATSPAVADSDLPGSTAAGSRGHALASGGEPATSSGRYRGLGQAGREDRRQSDPEDEDPDNEDPDNEDPDNEDPDNEDPDSGTSDDEESAD